MACGLCRHCIGERCMRWIEDEEPPVVGTEDGCESYCSEDAPGEEFKHVGN